ncbi:MAG TPA: M28 family peptidase, partial [Nannocystaceae bacterium]|nr:M28 family peptidase [Nannocystaceae bacterium]
DPLPHPVVLAATACEENGLAGARALADALPEEIGLAVSLDLVGSPGVLTLNGLGPNIGAPALERFVRAARASAVGIDAPLTHRVVSRLVPQIERSDHGVFAARGVPAVHLYHRGTVDRIYLPYHGPLDTIAEVDPIALADAAAFVRALVLDPTDLPDDPTPAATLVAGSIVVPNRVLFSIELAALLFVVASLHRLRRRPRDAGRPLRGLALAVLAWFIACSIVAAVEWLVADMAGHPQPWIHAPGRWIVAEALAIGCLFAALLGAGASPPVDARWSLPTGLVVAALPGAALLWLGIVELAWLPLFGASALALFAWVRTPSQRWLALAIAMLPAWILLQPGLLREASQHHFLPRTWLLAPLLATVLLPALLAVADAVVASRMSSRARAIAVVLALVSAIAMLASPPCDRASFRDHGLACELLRR